MSEELPKPSTTTPSDNPQQTGILNKTLGDVIQNNPQAQKLIMQAMGINQHQLQEMIAQASSNPMMNMPISDMFKNGIMQQAAQARGIQVSPEQFQQMMIQMNQNPQGLPQMPQTPTYQLPQNMQSVEPVMIPVGVTQVPVNGSPAAQPVKQSFFQRLKGLFK